MVSRQLGMRKYAQVRPELDGITHVHRAEHEVAVSSLLVNAL